MQLSFIQYLTYQGGVRAQIEGVRVHKEHRGVGIGKAIFSMGNSKSKGT
jgi:ribosomal protein S18 acetylase RimI-like enzyme